MVWQREDHIKGQLRVITTGPHHGWVDYETIVVPMHNWNEREITRSATQQEADIAHDNAVMYWQANIMVVDTDHD